MVIMVKCMCHQWSLWYVMILHVFSIKTIPLLRPLGLSPQGGRYRGILLYIYPRLALFAPIWLYLPLIALIWPYMPYSPYIYRIRAG